VRSRTEIVPSVLPFMEVVPKNVARDQQKDAGWWCGILLKVVEYITTQQLDVFYVVLLQLLPHFVLKIFADAPGFAGLFLATLYGGALRYFVVIA